MNQGVTRSRWVKPWLARGDLRFRGLGFRVFGFRGLGFRGDLGFGADG